MCARNSRFADRRERPHKHWQLTGQARAKVLTENGDSRMLNGRQALGFEITFAIVRSLRRIV